MIDEKRLLKKIKDYSEDIYGCDATNVDDVVDFQRCHQDNERLSYKVQGLYESVELIEDQPKVNEWISVEENLPTRGVNVLVSYRSIYCEYEDGSCDYFRGTDIDIAKYIDGEWYSSYDDDFDGKILAWMPLPKAYEGEINNEK